jgi:hypothetical protein
MHKECRELGEAFFFAFEMGLQFRIAVAAEAVLYFSPGTPSYA